MTTITAARRIEQLKQERDQLRADLERARGIAVALEGQLDLVALEAAKFERWAARGEATGDNLTLDPAYVAKRLRAALDPEEA